jgi:hypothetical protein
MSTAAILQYPDFFKVAVSAQVIMKTTYTTAGGVKNTTVSWKK